MKKSDICIYNFVNYRTFLRAICEDLKFKNSSVSYKTIQEAAGYSRTSNHLWQIMEGLTPISSSAVTNYCKALNLNTREIKYFRLMVEFDKAKTDKQRNSIISRMSSSKLFSKSQQNYLDIYEIFSSWYIPVLWDMVLLDDFKEDYDWIADKFFNEISKAKIKKGLEKLLESGLLIRDKNGKLIQKETEFLDHSATGKAVNSIAVAAGRNYIREMLNLSQNAIENQPFDKRIFYSSTIVMSKKDVETIKKKITDFNEEISETEHNEKEVIYQMNLQFFSQTKID